jgi:GNAT superfamily N-acetyltransferase
VFPADVARENESRQATGCAALADEVLWIAGGAACYSAATDWLNTVFGAGLSGAVTGEEIARLADFYEQRGVSPRIEVCPYAHPSFVAGLGRVGFRLDGFEQVFGRDLPAGEDLRHPHGWPDGVDVVRVDPDDDAQVDVFCEVSTSGFRGPEAVLAEDVRALQRRIVRHPRNDSFLALAAGAPIGGGSLEVLGSVASLFGTSVLPQWRRGGVQAALVIARLERARERGASIACIESQPPGGATERNALRLGFQVLYTKAMLRRP